MPGRHRRRFSSTGYGDTVTRFFTYRFVLAVGVLTTDGATAPSRQKEHTTAQSTVPTHVVTPIEYAEFIPGYTIELDPDTFRFTAETVTPGGPTFTGSLERCLRAVASEQGWSVEQLEATLAYNAS